jgi:hypothetical protein
MNDTTTTEIRYPDCVVELVGSDGNAFAIMGNVTRELKKHLRDRSTNPVEMKKIVDEFRTEAMSGDYDHLLQTCMRWVNVE